MVRSLPEELVRRGHDVRVIVPKYGFADYSEYSGREIFSGLTVTSLGEFRKVSLELIDVGEIPVYLVGADIFRRADAVYGGNEVEKFWVFCDCVSEAIARLDWRPEVVHCHDWHTALIPALARRHRESYRTVFTIHNIRYQGYFDEHMLYRSGIGDAWNEGIPGMPYIPWNLITQGILWADVISAVSRTFAEEILTAEGGQGMQDILQFRKDRLFGIVNGIGCEEYDPASDRLIVANYSYDTFDGKLANRSELLKKAGWKQDSAVPIIGMVSRLDEQKGLDIIVEAIPAILKELDVKFIFLGRGSDYYEAAVRGLEKRFPGNIKAFVTFDNASAHLIYAGSDMFLMPSKWEPCGLSQMVAMRYGTVPIVRKTGGLADTVSNLNGELKRGSGFMFTPFSAAELAGAVKRAVQAFSDAAAWKKTAQRIMKQDFSWSVPAGKYELLYGKALGQDVNETI